MSAADPVFLSVLRVPVREMLLRHPRLAAAGDGRAAAGGVRLLRSVLMKPESEAFVPLLLDKLEAVAASI